MTAPGITRFATAEVATILAIGVVGVLIAGLQPQLLGALAQEGRLSVPALGGVATAELLAMGVAAGTAGLILPIDRLRTIAALALVVLAALNFLTGYVPGPLILAVRAVAGLAEGVLVWLTIGMIVRTAHPAWWSGLYLTVQTGAQLALATAFGLWLIPAAGSAGGFAAIGVVALAALLVLPAMPGRFDALPTSPGETRTVPPRGWIGLASVAMWLAFVVAVWVYVEPLGLQRGLDHAQVAIVAPLSLAMQMLGAGAAMLLAGRVPAVPVLIGCALGNAALLVILGVPPSATAFVAATAVFGFFWLFAMPFQLPVVIAADPSRRAAELIGGAQLAGASMGPFLAARLIDDANVAGVLWFGAVALIIAVVLTVVAVIGRDPLAVR